MPIGIIVTLTGAVYFGTIARSAYMARQPYPFLRRLPAALLCGIVGATIDMMTGAFEMIVPDNYGLSAQFVVNVAYCSCGLYFMVASYYHRIIPLRFSSR